MVGTTLATEVVKRASRKGCPNHPIDLKRRLAALACEPDVSVSKLALTHGINANLLFRWRRQYRAGKFGTSAPEDMAGIIAPDAPRLIPIITAPQISARREARASGHIEIIRGDVVVRVCGEVSRSALGVVLDCLAAHE